VTALGLLVGVVASVVLCYALDRIIWGAE